MQSNVVLIAGWLFILVVIMLTAYLYVNGKWKVVPEKQQAYEAWVAKNSSTANRIILIISVIWVIVTVIRFSTFS